MGHKTNLSLNDQVIKSNMDVLYNISVQPSDYSPITLICTVVVEYSILVPSPPMTVTLLKLVTNDI